MTTQLAEVVNQLTTKMSGSNEKVNSRTKTESTTNDSTANPVRSECPNCSDTGIVCVDPVEQRYGQCKCVIRKRHARICAKAGFDIAEAKTLADYHEWNVTALKAKLKATDYVQHFDSIRRTAKNWFIIFGQSGSGKTMLGRAIVKALIDREYPIRARAVKYYDMMQKLKANANAEDYWRLLDDYTDCELLFIDDLLKEKLHSGELTEADVKHLFAVIDSRYDACRPTIITTECTSSRLEKLNEAIYYRMVERAHAEIVFEGEDLNFRKRV